MELNRNHAHTAERSYCFPPGLFCRHNSERRKKNRGSHIQLPRVSPRLASHLIVRVSEALRMVDGSYPVLPLVGTFPNRAGCIRELPVCADLRVRTAARTFIVKRT